MKKRKKQSSNIMEQVEANHGKILYSFVVMDEGFLQIETILIDDCLERLIELAETMLKDYLELNGYHEDELPELITEDGYCKIVKSKSGVTCYEYEEEVWNYKFDGEETVESAIATLKQKQSLSLKEMKK